MKKLLLLVAAFLAAASVRAQDESWYSWSNDWVRWDGGNPISLGVQNFQEEGGANLTSRSIVNCIGAGITCADDGVSKTTITVAGGAGDVATDAIWDAAGDLAVGTGANTAAKLTKGADGKVLTMTAGAVGWASLPAAGGAVNLQASSPGTPDVGNWNITGVGTSTHDNIHATLTPGLFLSNTQAALVGQQREYSPSLKLCGAGWNVGGAASETNCWQIFDRPIGGTPSSADLAFQTSLAGAAYMEKMVLDSSGKLSLGEATVSDGQLRLYGATSGSITFAPTTGALGTQVITVPAVTGTMATTSNPAFTLFSVNNGATGPGSFNILEDSDNGTNYIQVTVPAALATSNVYTFQDVGGNGTIPISPTNYPGLGFNPKTTSRLFEDFYARATQAASGGGTNIGLCGAAGAGASSGYLLPATATMTGPLAFGHPGIALASTGTTLTGSGSIVCGNTTAGNSDTPQLVGGEILEIGFELPVASNQVAGDTFRALVGFCDQVLASACEDEVAIYWDNNADTHWGCEEISNTSALATLSTTVATAAAWHVARFEVNADATSVAVTVDGSALSCSPMTTHIPTGSSRGTAPMLKITNNGSGSSCNASADCVIAVDYVYFYQPGLSR